LAAEPELLLAWLNARSLARGLAPPIEEFGGFRVDSNSAKEVRRWVFAEPGPGIETLARSIREPRHFIKLCGTEGELREALFEPWVIQGGSWFMGLKSEPAAIPPLQPGYDLKTSGLGAVTRIEIRSNGGELAASGYAAETSRAFVYDRIETDRSYRRRGLGRAVMAALGACRKSQTAAQLLMATAEGERLYSALGWTRLSPYSTAFLPEGA
jgi:GNAT superfamily N-acetyltransferase